jgi:putative ABC transport system substrate-binding protein
MRRDVVRIALRIFAAGLAAWPLALRAQQATIPVVGFMNGGTSEGYAGPADAFRAGLADAGYIEGRNITVEYRWANGRYDRLPAFAADLVRRQVSVIVATTTPGALAAKMATTFIPIVFETAGDPITLGLVTSMNRPGGNITGVTQWNSELLPKRLGLLHELLPTATVGFLVNSKDPRAESQADDILAAARALGHQVQIVNVSNESEFKAAFAKLSELGATAVVIGTSELFNNRPSEIAALASERKMPSMFQLRQFVAAGGLMSYGARIADAYRLGGAYTGRILKGEKPADLPVVRPTTFDLVINLKTAKELGVTIPSGVLAIADEVIE